MPPWLLKLGFQPGGDDGGDFIEEVSFDLLVGGQLSIEHDPDGVVDLPHQQALDHRGAQRLLVAPGRANNVEAFPVSVYDFGGALGPSPGADSHDGTTDVSVEVFQEVFVRQRYAVHPRVNVRCVSHHLKSPKINNEDERMSHLSPSDQIVS